MSLTPLPIRSEEEMGEGEKHGKQVGSYIIWLFKGFIFNFFTLKSYYNFDE